MSLFSPISGSIWKPIAGKNEEGGGGYDADAQSYITDLETAGATISTTKKDAINAWVIDGKTNGWWSKLIEAWYWTWGAAGPNAVSALGSTGTFSGGGWTHSTEYSQPNGITDYFRTGVIPATHMGVSPPGSTLGLYVYDDSPNIGDIDVGVFETGKNYGELSVYAPGGTSRFFYGAASNFPSVATPSPKSGLWIGYRNGSATGLERKLSSGFSSLATATDAGDPETVPTIEYYVGARNLNGSIDDPCNKNLSAAIFGIAMSAGERQAMADATYTLLSALGVTVV